eukprot:3942011-Rhodomonas_salina.4
MSRSLSASETGLRDWMCCCRVSCRGGIKGEKSVRQYLLYQGGSCFQIDFAAARLGCAARCPALVESER